MFVKCNDVGTISKYLWDDLVADCEDLSDEPQLMLLLLVDIHVTCVNKIELPCKQGHSKCFNFTDICVYRLDSSNVLLPCRNGGHLQQCNEFQCGSMFKCPDSYCIGWSEICDGKQHCPHGGDENYHYICGRMSRCTFAFKCKDTHSICIHLQNVCDGHEDCPFEDDEMVCELKSERCPAFCNCFLFAFFCEKRPLHISGAAFPYMFVEVHHSPVNNLETFCTVFPHVLLLNIQYNNITDLCTQNLPPLLYTVNLSSNLLSKISRNCFCSSHKLSLQVLDLEHNCITSVESHSFNQLTQLAMLKLSHNPLETLPDDMLPNSMFLNCYKCVSQANRFKGIFNHTQT